MTDTPVVEVPKPLTKADIRKWTADDMKKAIHNGQLDEINRVLAAPEVIPDPEPTAEEVAAQEEADAQAVAQAEVDAAAALAAKDAADAAAAQAAEAAKPKKIVVEYQATDEAGQPIGRPTHLEAASWEEMSKKQTDAHINALRYAERIKNRKVTQKQPESPRPELTQEELVAAAADLDSDDPVKKAAAIRKLNRTDLIEKELEEAAIETKNAREASISYAFMRNHLHDFNPCAANGQLLSDYLKDNNLEWTEDNLEEAFSKVENQLAPVVKPEPVAPNAPAEPTPVPAAVVPAAPAAEPVAAPVVASAPAPAAPNAPAPARRVPSGGIQPGSLTAGRPATAKPAGLTKAQIKAWTGEQMRAYMRKPGGVAEINRVLKGE